MKVEGTASGVALKLELTGREFEILRGVVNFPDWDSQPDDVEDFLSNLSLALADVVGEDADYVSPDEVGFVNITSF